MKIKGSVVLGIYATPIMESLHTLYISRLQERASGVGWLPVSALPRPIVLAMGYSWRWRHQGSGRGMDHLAYHAQIRQLFTEAVTGPENRLDLARAALLIASEAYPGLDILRYVAKLEVMAAAGRPTVP